MSGRLRIGIAGYGVVGRRRRNFIDQHPNMETVAVCDRVFDGDGELGDGTPFHDRYERLLQHELDALFVCLTNDIAAKVTIAALERGLHVFCEKPPGRDLQDIADIMECEARHPDLKLKFGFNHRYHHSVRDALDLIRSGNLGEIINLRGVYGKSKIISFESDWRTKREIAGGGILLDQGIHMLDLLRLFAGEFDDIRSFVDNKFWNHDVEDNAYALMRTADGKVAFMHSSATQWEHQFNLEIALSRGALVLSGILSGSKSYGSEIMQVLRRSEDQGGETVRQFHHYDEDPSWADEIAEFAAAIRGSGDILYGTSDDAAKTMQLVYRIYCADPDWKAQWNLDDRIPPAST
ncbi:MAG: Gfo/Idh/MocA family oxidoreductase [Pseudomonadota bacterium]|nr:Gfo/Idh/MocA family oxidoreductase [Pseudomonadota bacterium]